MKNQKYNLKRLFVDHYFELCSFFIVFIYMIIYMIINNVAPFGKNCFSAGDTLCQSYPFLASLQNKIKNGESLLYSWNGALGSDYLPLYFYYLASPFNFLLGLIGKDSLCSFISLGIAIKLSFSSLFFCAFLSNRFKEEKHKFFFVLFSCAYALSAYMCCYSYQLLWLDSLMVFPLIMLGYDKLIKEDKPILYILSLAYSIYVNYYISYMICLFLVIWFLFDKHDSIKCFFRRFLKFSLYSIISAGLVFFSLYISYKGISKTVSMNEEFADHYWYGNIFEVIRQLFIFPQGIYSSYIPNDTNIYCGLLTVLLVLLYIFVRKVNIWDRVKRIIVIGLLLLSLNENVLNYIWHGFHTQHSVPNRFAFLLIFVLLLTAAETLFYIESINSKLLVCGCIFTECLPIISYVFVDYNSSVSSSHVIFFSMMILLVYSLFIIVSTLVKDQKKGKIIHCIIAFVVLIEILLNSNMFLKTIVMDYSQINEYYDKVNYCKKEVEDDTSDIYRSDVKRGMTDNDNSYHDMKGVSVFNSELNKKVPIFLQAVGYYTGINRIMNMDSYEFINDILGIKYLYTYGEDLNYGNKSIYTEVYNNDIHAYRNDHALAIGFGAPKSIGDDMKLSNYDVTNNINNLASHLGSEEKLFNEIFPQYKVEAYECELSKGDSDFLSFMYETQNDSKYVSVSYDVESEGEYYVYIDDSNEDRFIIAVDETILYDGIWATYGLQNLGYLKPGNSVQVILTDNNGEKYQSNELQSEVKIHTYIEDHDAMDKLYNKLSQNQMQITEFTDNHFCGDVYLEDDQILFTSIPYDEGWHVYEDGKELNKRLIANAFLGLDLGKGKHRLSFKYIPEGLYFGWIVSAVFWCLFIIICILSGRKKNATSLTDNSINDTQENE